MHSLRLICCFLFAAASGFQVRAQTTFHFKSDSLISAYGLAVMPDSSIVAGGYQAGCFQILRLSLSGDVLWTKKICPRNKTESFESNSLQIIPGVETGSFFALFRFLSDLGGPQHVLELLKFNAAGDIQWECQLPPYVSFGALASGNQMAVSPDGAVWAVHGIGVTQFVPTGQSFNQVLLFKVSSSGDLQLRNSYQTDEESSANGVFIRGNNEVYVYGGLGNLLADGFLLKISGDGSILWAKKYKNFYFYRDGGRFSNGDQLLYGSTPEGLAFARLRPSDGALVWLKKIDTYPESSLFAVAADQGIFAAVRIPGNVPQRAILKCAPGVQEVDWLHRYEDCTGYFMMNAQATPDGGLVATQYGNVAVDQTRLLKMNKDGRFETGCNTWDAPLPLISDLSVLPPENLVFTMQHGPLPLKTIIAAEYSSMLNLVDVCPGSYPAADLAVPDSACAGSPARLEATGNANADRWQWTLPGAADTTMQGLVAEPVLYAQEGIFPVTLIQRYGVCADTVQDSIRVTAPLEAHLFAYNDTLHCIEKPFQAFPLPGGGFDAWQWEDGSTAPLRILDPPQAGILKLTAQKGLCRVTDSINLRLARCQDSDLFVPNVFAPDSKGDNARWEVSLHPGSSLLFCSIYDRWGALLYATGEGEMPHWEGNCRGKQLPAGVYPWVIGLRKPDGVQEILTGNLTLLR